MKFVFKLTLAVLLFGGSNTFALDDDQSPQETYTLFCGSAKALSQIAEGEGRILSKAEVADLAKSRVPVLTILEKGAAGIQELLKQGSASETGGFGALLACGVITQVKAIIIAKGCTDLSTGKVVKDHGGIAACEAINKFGK
jgi:hypothetical protein